MARSANYSGTVMIELFPFFLLTLYLAPFLMAAARGHDGIGAILVANLLIGWTGIGWIALLAWSAWTPQSRAAAVGRARPQRASSNR